MAERVLVCGGRFFNDRDFIWNKLIELDAEHGPFKVVIHGCATGADQEGMGWAQACGRLHAPFKAAWRDISHPNAVIRQGAGYLYDALAGHRRNQRMIDEGRPELVIAFPGGTGTADMVKRAKAADIPVIEVSK